MLQQIEAEIVQTLKDGLPTQVRVLAWPDMPGDSGRTHLRDAVYVRFAAIDLDTPQGNLGSRLQTGRMRFEVRVLSRDLRSHTGSYSLIEQVQQLLAGSKPAIVASADLGYSFGLRGFGLTQVKLFDRVDESGQWDWSLVFESEILRENTH